MKESTVEKPGVEDGNKAKNKKKKETKKKKEDSQKEVLQGVGGNEEQDPMVMTKNPNGKKGLKVGSPSKKKQTDDNTGSPMKQSKIMSRDESKKQPSRGSPKKGKIENKFQVIVIKEVTEEKKEEEENEDLLKQNRIKKRDEAITEREANPLPGDVSLVEIKEDFTGNFLECIFNQEIMLTSFKFLFAFKLTDILDKQKNVFQRKSRHENVLRGGEANQRSHSKKSINMGRKKILQSMKSAELEIVRQNFKNSILASDGRFITKKNYLKFKEYSHVREANYELEIRNLQRDFSKLRKFSYFFLRLLM